MPLPKAELLGQLRSYLTSDAHPPDIHFGCHQERCRERAWKFLDRTVWENGNQEYREEWIYETLEETKDFGRRFRILIPFCFEHAKKRKQDNFKEYEEGRSLLWKAFRKRMLEGVMES